VRAGTALNDSVTGLAAAGAALMGWISAQRTGQGQSIDVAQYEIFFTLLENLALDYFLRGVVRGRYGNAHQRLHPYDVHRAKDGWVVVAAPTPSAWLRLRERLGIAPGPWDDMAWRTAHREQVDPPIIEFCAARTLAELEAIGRETDSAITRVQTIEQIAQDPHYVAREMFVEWEDPVAGHVKGAGIAPKFSTTPGRVWRGAPWLGQDNAAILETLLGYSAERTAALEASGVVGSDPPPRNEDRS